MLNSQTLLALGALIVLGTMGVLLILKGDVNDGMHIATGVLGALTLAGTSAKSSPP